MSIGAECGQNILQMHNSKNFEDSMGLNSPNPHLLCVRQWHIVNFFH